MTEGRRGHCIDCPLGLACTSSNGADVTVMECDVCTAVVGWVNMEVENAVMPLHTAVPQACATFCRR